MHAESRTAKHSAKRQEDEGSRKGERSSNNSNCLLHCSYTNSFKENKIEGRLQDIWNNFVKVEHLQTGFCTPTATTSLVSSRHKKQLTSQQSMTESRRTQQMAEIFTWQRQRAPGSAAAQHSPGRHQAIKHPDHSPHCLGKTLNGLQSFLSPTTQHYSVEEGFVRRS